MSHDEALYDTMCEFTMFVSEVWPKRGIPVPDDLYGLRREWHAELSRRRRAR